MRDIDEYHGPLAGLAIRLHALADRAHSVYATGCDAPLLMPAFVAHLFDMLGDQDAAVPFDGEHYHSLAAVYRPSVLPHITRLLNAQRLQARLLFANIRAREISLDELRDVDPQLQSLENLNCEQDYLAAIYSAGFTSTPKGN